MALIRNAAELHSLSLSIPTLPTHRRAESALVQLLFLSKWTLPLFPLKFGNPDRSFSIRQDVKNPLLARTLCFSNNFKKCKKKTPECRAKIHHLVSHGMWSNIQRHLKFQEGRASSFLRNIPKSTGGMNLFHSTSLVIYPPDQYIPTVPQYSRYLPAVCGRYRSPFN